MKTWELDSKYYFNYLVAYRHAGMGLSLVLHPHLSLLLSLFAFISKQCQCFCLQVCMSPSCQKCVSKKGEKSYKVLLAIPKFSSNYKSRSGLHLGMVQSEGCAGLSCSVKKNNLDNDDLNVNFHKGFFLWPYWGL